MAEYTVKDMEVVKDMPGNPEEKGGPAKVYKLSLEEDERQPEMFAVASTVLPMIGAKVEGEIDDSDPKWPPKFKKAGGRKGGGGGFQKSPAQEKRIVRQHSQEMALREQAALIAAGHRPLSEEQLENLIGWFEADAYGKQKQGVVAFPMTSDVPGDDAGLP